MSNSARLMVATIFPGTKWRKLTQGFHDNMYCKPSRNCRLETERLTAVCRRWRHWKSVLKELYLVPFLKWRTQRVRGLSQVTIATVNTGSKFKHTTIINYNKKQFSNIMFRIRMDLGFFADPDPGFFVDPDPGFKSPDLDPSINKLMGSKWWFW